MKSIKTDEGFIMKIVLFIVAIVALKYVFHFDVLEWIKSDQAQKIIQPVWSVIKSFYFWVDGLFRSHAN